MRVGKPTVPSHKWDNRRLVIVLTLGMLPAVGVTGREHRSWPSGGSSHAQRDQVGIGSRRRYRRDAGARRPKPRPPPSSGWVERIAMPPRRRSAGRYSHRASRSPSSRRDWNFPTRWPVAPPPDAERLRSCSPRPASYPRRREPSGSASSPR